MSELAQLVATKTHTWIEEGLSPVDTTYSDVADVKLRFKALRNYCESIHQGYFHQSRMKVRGLLPSWYSNSIQSSLPGISMGIEIPREFFFWNPVPGNSRKIPAVTIVASMSRNKTI